MAAQIEAIATNSVPPLKLFSGDDVYTEDAHVGHARLKPDCLFWD